MPKISVSSTVKWLALLTPQKRIKVPHSGKTYSPDDYVSKYTIIYFKTQRSK